MSSPFTTASGHLVADLAMWNELVTAHNERSLVSDAVSEFVVDTPVRMSTAKITGLQVRVSDLFTQDWVLGETPPSTTATVASTYTSADWTIFLEDAGMSTQGFRRATTFDRDTDDWADVDSDMWSRPENGYGLAQAGDIIGPWIFDDLQKAFSRMKYKLYRQPSVPWITPYLAFSNKGEKTLYKRGSYQTPTSWLDAQSEAETRYNAFVGTLDSLGIWSYASGSWLYPNGFSASFSANINYIEWSAHRQMGTGVPPAFKNGAVYFYLKGYLPGVGTTNAFHANGSGLQEDVFVNIDMSTVSAVSALNPVVYSDLIGSLQLPAYADPVVPGDPSNARGFSAGMGYNDVFLIYEPDFTNSN